MKLKMLAAMTTLVLLSGCQSTSIKDAMNKTLEVVSNSASKGIDAIKGNSDARTLGTSNVHKALLTQDPLLANYGSAVILLFTAQEIWLNAMGDSEAAAALNAERTALESGAVIDSDAIERYTELSEKTNAIIKKSTTDEADLSRSSKIQFATGWVPYLAGLKQTKDVVDYVGTYASDINENIKNLRELGQNIQKTYALTTVTLSSPKFLDLQYDTLKLVHDFAVGQEIEVPKEVDAVVADMEL